MNQPGNHLGAQGPSRQRKILWHS